ncbi:hypothetical protein HPB48_006265 [Haemaphysalis longicornis]|uniref:Peptidase M13 C-terminal domain-containing protein n=1 Tax=Haemaphysalis longicornis TaxID=44386 RepID=A0A9J6GQC2_HAELO|nr:hypothetical protein HPB48_006265 [Haemaphysalis longicornis]
MELAPLVEVNLGPRKTFQLSLGDLNTTVGSDDVLGAMRTMRRDSSWLGQLAEDVAAFSHKMTALVYSHEPPISHQRLSDADLVLRPFLQVALEGLGRDAGAVRTELGSFIDPLVQLVRETRPETVLNLLGYRLVRHVGLFTPAVVNADLGSAQLSRRRSRCTRVVLEDALTGDAAEYIRYVALQGQLDFDAILSVKTDLKRVLSAKLAILPWMNNQTRKRAQQRLRDLKVRFYLGRYEDSNGSAPVFPVEALPSQALATYQVFREARFKSRMLRFDAVKDNATDPDCTHDARENVLYLRLSSAVETHDIRSPLWPLLQAARLAPMLSRCMLRVLLLPETPPHREAQHRGNRFSAAGSARFNELLACLRAHHTLGRSASTGRGRGTRAVIHSAALEPARNAYDAYVVRLARETSLEQLIGSRDALTTLGWNQLYYVAYARAMCESPDHRGPKEPHIPQRELVNGPLSNDRGFHRAFNCRRGDPMRPEPTCHFWDRPPR